MNRYFNVILATGFIFLILPINVHTRWCYSCPPTTLPFLCYSVDCGFGVPCFTQAWLEDGLTYYMKGCYYQSAYGSCDALARHFCTNTNSLHCCNSDNCNSLDPLQSWKPLPPTNIVPYVSTNFIELTWDPVCAGNYMFYIDYFKLGDEAISVSVRSNSVDIYNLEPDTEYNFRLKSFYGGWYSTSQILTVSTMSTSPAVTSGSLNTVKCLRTERYFGAPSSLHDCADREHYCFAQVEYFANTSERLLLRGCISESRCKDKELDNLKKCSPGEIGATCSFCCKGAYCNNQEWIDSGLTCNDISVSERILCGWSGISMGDCIQRGCCYVPSNDTVAWCHHGKYPRDTTPTIPVAQAGGLDLWVILLIVAVIILLLLIIAIIACCYLKKKRENSSGFYDVYATPKPKEDRRPHISTVFRESYDNMVIED